ncbi:helix-turn-helix transcriptional regulator [Aestuariivita boseongensis]|uniref:helix-turn-helix transcriptional regulator n=1 Tax=Aestuariivita boseongensis TaxID=1470562 RepID=UPI00068107EA|nr:helix-turn-helix transcriptional regulator [Aestuariivita boseongensis]
MVRDTLTGSRIRERRTITGLRQADLARQVGISASYLNLIEHNRRRIGGKLLVDIATELGVEPSLLTDGAEAALIASLREAAADLSTAGAELDRVDEFAGRFPGWAALLTASHRRVASLERTVGELSDRLNHDPHLAASLHEVLSTATAIRSTASILAENDEIEPEWRARFHRNLNEDSLRLADSSKALVDYLDDSEEVPDRRAAPQEEVEAFFAETGHHFPALEEGSLTPDQLARDRAALTTDAARAIAGEALRQYASDAAALPLPDMRAALGDLGLDPAALAAHFDVPLQMMLRRVAAMPDDLLETEVGLVVCDASGSILFRKQVTGFALPRFGASCPLWPVFTALTRPQVPLRRTVAQIGRSTACFECFAVAHPRARPGFDEDPLYLSTMLIVPVAQPTDRDVPEVGSTCRVCPRTQCPARREPSVLREEF